MSGGRSLVAESARPFPDPELARYSYGEDLRRRAGRFATLLDQQIPLDADVLHAGAGGGELACFLALRGRRVVGLAATESSLDRARALARRLRIEGVEFREAGAAAAGVPDAGFDHVLAPAGLPGTGDTETAFRELAGAVRPGGFLVFGLRNAVATLGRSPDGGGAHTVGRALAWLEEEGLSYVDSLPPVELFRGTDDVRLFRPADAAPWRRGRLARGLVQLGWIWSLRGEDGRFVLVGRK